jgi:putative transposase
MRKSRFTDLQIVAILKEGEAGVSIDELTRKHKISRATYFNWRGKHGGVSVSKLKRMKELEAENAKLKRMYAELALENAAITCCPENCRAVREAGAPAASAMEHLSRSLTRMSRPQQGMTLRMNRYRRSSDRGMSNPSCP